MLRLSAALFFVFAMSVYPPPSSAQQTASYTWTAPTTGGAVLGYTVYLNPGTGTWIVAQDSATTRSYTYTQPAGTSHQVKVAAFNRAVTPIMSGELIIGTAVGPRRYGPDSPLSTPSTVDPAAPGGCGRPVKQ